MSSILVFILVSGVCFSVGYSLLRDSDGAVGRIDCRYTQKEYDDAIASFSIPIKEDPYAGAPAPPQPIDDKEIKQLHGMCAVDALGKAKELGVMVVRDLSYCWNDCVVTADYSEFRLTFHVDGNLLLDPTLG